MADPVNPTSKPASPKPARKTPGRKPAAAKVKTTTASAAPKPRAAKATSTRGKAKAKTANGSAAWRTQANDIKVQAGKTARAAADTAKDKTGSALQGLSKLISDTASSVDVKLGPQYGDYARYAAEAVAGAAKSLDAKDVDQLIGEARDFVRKSPAVAIGAAAVVGFVLMRLAKGSSSDA